VISNSLSAALQLISNFRNLVAFGALLIFSLIELSIATRIIVKYNAMAADAMNPTPITNSWVAYLLGISIWTIISGALYSVEFLKNPYSGCAGVGSHLLLYAPSHSTHHYKFSFKLFNPYSLFSTWLTWLVLTSLITNSAFAGKTTASWTGGLFCRVPPPYVFCGLLNALAGFAWLIWCVAV
jgi:hypothetical protein